VNKIRAHQIAGLLLIVVPVIFITCFTILQMQFEYPDILRQPTEDVLRKFQAGGSGLIATWYVLTLSAVLFIPTTVLVYQILAGDRPAAFLRIALAFGVVAGLVQTLGFLRWPFLVPHLAAVYAATDTSAAQREATVVVFEAFHRYAGVAIGEHFGYLSTSVWTLLIAQALVQARLIKAWLGVLGMALALGIAAGLLEGLGWELAGAINAISYLAWALWLIVIGAVLLARRADIGV